MRSAIGLWAAAAALVWAGAARGDPDNRHYQVQEHHLVPADEGTAQPKIDEDVQPAPVWDWPTQHLIDGRDFVPAFLGPQLYPHVSVGSELSVDNVRPTGAVEYASWITAQLWALEVKIPLVSQIDAAPTGGARVHVNLKVPFALPGFPSNRFAIVAGAIIQDSTPALSHSSYAELMYGYGGHGFNLQLRGGYGYDQFMPSQPLRLGTIYGALLGFRAGAFQPSVELDGFHTTATHSDRFSVVPGLHIFPDRVDTLQFGLGGLLTFKNGDDTPGKRFGGVVNISYNFL